LQLIFEKSRPGRRAGRVPAHGLPVPEVPAGLRRDEPPRLPEIAEPDLVRHFTKLSTRNFGIDTGFYPLGSCTMKYNPRVNERLVMLPGFRDLHPLQEEEGAQGALELMWRLQEILAEVVGQAITSDAWRIAGNAQDGEAGAESFRRAIEDAGLAPDEIGTVYGDARGTAALDLAEARAIGHVWKPGGVRVANITGQVGHLHSTTPLLAAVCATETVRTGWAPRPAAAREPLPELAEHLAAEPCDDTRACVVTAVNWGGTYASVVLRGWSGE